jgi:DNA-binding MarR family transcriptional regulator
MPQNHDFDLGSFLPYMLNQAAEATSRSFHAIYHDRYGMTRTQWRVMANLGKFGAMTARDICALSHIEKTKVSRAVAALEAGGHLLRKPGEQDRRTEILSLTEAGRQVYHDLGQHAIAHDRTLRASLGPDLTRQLDAALVRLTASGTDATPTETPAEARRHP